MNKIIRKITLPVLLALGLATYASAQNKTAEIDINRNTNQATISGKGIDYHVIAPAMDDSTKPVAKTPFKATALDKLVDHNIERFSWDRFYVVNDTTINNEKYFAHKQVLDKDTWLSSRWNQIFNNSNYKFGKDNEKIKEIVALNYKINYGVDLDTAKIHFAPDIEDSSKIKDIIYAGKIKGRRLISSGNTATTNKGHVIIPADMTIYAPENMYNRKQEKELEIKLTEPVQPTPAISGNGKKDDKKTDYNNDKYPTLTPVIGAGLYHNFDSEKPGAFVTLGLQNGKFSLEGIAGMSLANKENVHNYYPGPFGSTTEDINTKTYNWKAGVIAGIGGKLKLEGGLIYDANHQKIETKVIQELLDRNYNLDRRLETTTETSSNTGSWKPYGGLSVQTGEHSKIRAGITGKGVCAGMAYKF